MVAEPRFIITEKGLAALREAEASPEVAERWIVRPDHPLAVPRQRIWSIIGAGSGKCIARDMVKEVAEHIVELHNDWLEVGEC